MSNLTQALQRIGEAVEESRRAFGALATEAEIAAASMKSLRKEIEEGRKREAELRNLLREKGLASYDQPDDQGRPNHDPRNS